MNPYSLQRRAESYMEDSSQRPLIRRCINEALKTVCASNDQGRDWSFLVEKGRLGVEYTDGESRIGIATLPSYVRSVIEIEDGENYTCHLDGRSVAVVAKDAASRPADIVCKVYKTQLNISANPTDLNDFDTPWTKENPADSSIILPDEAEEAVLYKTLQLLAVHEVEVAVNIQALDSLYAASINSLKANYQYQVDSRPPLGADGEELLTMRWLVEYAKGTYGGERDTYQLVRLANRAASDIADRLNLRGSQRPKNVNGLDEPLPDFGCVNENYMGGPSVRKKIPSAYWQVAMNYQCARSNKTLDQALLQEYEEAMKGLSSLFYSLATGRSFEVGTYGGTMDYLRGIWKNQRNDQMLWYVLNQTVSEVMRALNPSDLLSRAELPLTSSPDGKSFRLPEDFKQAVQVFLHGLEVVGHGYAQRGSVRLEQRAFQFEGRCRSFVRHNAFSIRGNFLVFDHPVACNPELWYYPKHLFPEMTEENLAKKIPIDYDLVVKALEARVALENGDGGRYSALRAEFKEALADFSESCKDRNLAQDDRIVCAVPNLDYMLDISTGWWY